MAWGRQQPDWTRLAEQANAERDRTKPFDFADELDRVLEQMKRAAQERRTGQNPKD
jgi:hypothetical protein